MERQSLKRLQSILLNMKVSNEKSELPKAITKLGTSNLFKYATSQPDKLTDNRIQTWEKLRTDFKRLRNPQNGFEEAIILTELGRMWQYPIDNEFGLDEEKKVPFEEHVFLDKHLEGFPKNEYIQGFMQLVISGLARNNWMTVERKRKVIMWYKDYFESKRDLYKQAGFEM